MAWNGSGWFGSWYALTLRSGALYGNLLGTQIFCALFGPDVTPNPDPDVTARYGIAPWNGGIGGGNWAGSGEWLRSITVSGQAGVALADPVAVKTPDNPSSGINATITAHGDMCYDKGSVAVTNIGWCYHDFGGPVSSVVGIFQVIWHTDGVAVVDVAVT